MRALIAIFVAAGWTTHSTKDGITVETRPVAGSAFDAVRVSKASRVPPAVQAEAIWGVPGIEGVANRKTVTTHIVLEDTPNRRRYYEVVSAPMISNRDYVLRTERSHDGDLYEIRFASVDDPAYPPKDGFVRMIVKGSCTIEPAEGGGSIVTYEVFSDLNGSIPAWVAKGAQRDSSIEWINVMLERGEKAMKR